MDFDVDLACGPKSRPLALAQIENLVCSKWDHVAERNSPPNLMVTYHCNVADNIKLSFLLGQIIKLWVHSNLTIPVTNR